MSFELAPKSGTVVELEGELVAPPQHEREEQVIEVVKKAIGEIVASLDGYLSVSANGNINSVSGETGDLVNIYITSLSPPSAPVPANPPVEVPVTPPVEIGTGQVPIPDPPVETPVTPIVPVPVVPAGETPPVVEPPVNTETLPDPTPPVVTENPAENPPVPSGEGPDPVVVETPATPPAETPPSGGPEVVLPAETTLSGEGIPAEPESPEEDAAEGGEQTN